MIAGAARNILQRLFAISTGGAVSAHQEPYSSNVTQSPKSGGPRFLKTFILSRKLTGGNQSATNQKS